MARRAFWPTLVARIVPAVLIALAFAMSVVAIVSKHWARQLVVTTGFNSDSQVYLLRSPFWNCTYGDFVPNGGTPEPNPIVTCNRTNTPGGLCDPLGWDNVPFCQQLAMVGKLLIAACILLGVSLLVAPTVTIIDGILGGRRSTKHYPRRGEQKRSGAVHAFLSYATVFLWLATGTGATCMAAAQFLGWNTLVNLQFPNGEFLVPGNAPDKISAWVPDSAVSYAAASWILAAFAAATLTPLLSVWDAGGAGDQGHNQQGEGQHVETVQMEVENER